MTRSAKKKLCVLILLLLGIFFCYAATGPAGGRDTIWLSKDGNYEIAKAYTYIVFCDKKRNRDIMDLVAWSRTWNYFYLQTSCGDCFKVNKKNGKIEFWNKPELTPVFERRLFNNFKRKKDRWPPEIEKLIVDEFCFRRYLLIKKEDDNYYFLAAADVTFGCKDDKLPYYQGEKPLKEFHYEAKSKRLILKFSDGKTIVESLRMG